MKILITGSSGFLGKWVSEMLLKQGYEIRGVDFQECLYNHLKPYHQKIDILNFKSTRSVIKGFAPEAIIHLAARCDLEGKKLYDYSANIEGVRNICRAVAESPSVKKVIYTSSMLVCKVGYIPQADNDYKPDTIYGESKVLTEKIVREEDGGGCCWCLVRPTTVWGPWMSDHYLQLLRAIQRGMYFHSGGGALYKSYSYAGNIAYQYLQLLQAPSEKIHRKTFYLADYEPLSLRNYTDALARAMGARKIPTLPLIISYILARIGDLLNYSIWENFPYNSFRLRNIRTEYVFDLSKTENVCGKLPFKFEDGVKETVKWYLDKQN